MARTQLTGQQIGDGKVQRDDLDTTTAAQAVIRKVIAGVGATVTSTGVDAGTGDVTITAAVLGTFTASEALAAGNLVNTYDNAGVFGARNADGSAANKYEAHGYVLAVVASAGTATVYFSGLNTAVSGLTPGPRYLSATTPGASVSATTAATYTGGQLVQQVGVALSATVLSFARGDLIETS